MQHVTLKHRDGKLALDTAPEPVVQAGHVLIANRASVISAGTERAARELARQSLFTKARQRPDHVLKVLRRIGRDGLRTTVRQVREKLDEPLGLGYCSAGVVLACGAGVQEFKPGDRVASNGPHAEVVCVPRNLCARVPDTMPFDQAAFTVPGAIALQGVRLSRVALGETAFVIGLGMIGQLTVALAKASGARVIATDPDESRCALAQAMGADIARPHIAADEVQSATRGLGGDCVLITAATPSHGPVQLAGDAVRQKGRVVAVGAVGMDLPRSAFYYKEAEFIVSCSYGPGRYDPAYEELGRDYPPAYVRWTEQRNMQAVLDLAGAGRIDLAKLISHRFPIERAAEAYELMETKREPHLGIVLEYPEWTEQTSSRQIRLAASPRAGRCGVGCLGTGDFARGVLLPAIARVPAARLEVLCSARGVPAAQLGTKLGFATATSDEREIFDNPRVDAVFIATRHDQHARQLIEAIRAGKHAFVEKPMAISEEELARIEDELAETGGVGTLVMVDFNRRFSPAARLARELIADIREPITISIRVNAGSLPPGHWLNRPTGGGRIIGEACHFIDLATYLTASLPTRVFAESVGGEHAPTNPDERCFITLRHASGAVSNVAYLAGGDPAVAKERIEIIGGGRVVLIDDFRELTQASRGKLAKVWSGRQDKGHAAAVSAFFQAIAEGGPAPISWAEMRSTTLASILAVRSLREGVPLDVR